MLRYWNGYATSNELNRTMGRRWRSLLQFLGLFCLFCLLAVSCTGSLPTTQASDRVRIGTTLKIRTLDPADAYDIASNLIIYNLSDRLYSYDAETGEIVPQLATELPTISTDNLTYTIPLRQGVVFHDGTPFNAEAMVFSLRRFIESKGGPSFLIADFIQNIEATGEYELTITLNRPFSPFVSVLAYPGLCAVSPEYYTIAEGNFKPDVFVGTGPYRLVNFGNDAITLEVFDRYWGDKPDNSGIDLQRFSSSANLYNAFRSAAIDVAYHSLDSDQTQSLEKLAPEFGWSVISADSNVINYMVLNSKQPPLDRLKVRQALASAIDRNLIDDRVFYGQAEPLYSLIPKAFEVYEPVFQKQYGDANLDMAKSLLKEAGFSVDNPATIEIWYPSGSADRRLGATVIEAQIERDLDGIIDIEPHAVEATTAYGFLDRGVYPIFMLDWYADFFDVDNYIKPFLDCADGSEDTGCIEGETQIHGSFFYSDRVNELVDRQRRESNPEVRKQILYRLQEVVAENVPYIPLWQSRDYAFAGADITGVQLTPGQQLLRFASISRQ